MADPVLVVHGVANRDTAAFTQQVVELNRQVGSAWRFIPVFWGDLGGATAGLEDTIPQPRLVDRGDHSETAAPSPALVASLLTGPASAARTRAASEGWRIVAEAANRGTSTGATGTGAALVRGESDTAAIRAAIAEAWPLTTTLQTVADSEVLREIGQAIALSLPGAGATGFEVRGGLDDVKGWVGGIVRGLDRAVGAVVGLAAAKLNTYLRSELGPFIGRFLGDILAYQQDQDAIQDRLWQAIAREAPGWGTAERPLAVVAHSLGGVISFDAALGVPRRQLFIRRLVTFGSQSAFFHVIVPRGGPLGAYHPGLPVELPPAIGGWTNLWEPLDPLAFLAGKVFRLHPAAANRAPVDIEVPHRVSAGLWTHSAYWDADALVEAIRGALT